MNAIETPRPGPTTWTTRALMAVAAACAVCLISACNTTEGFGRDVENLGDNIEDGAHDAKN